MKPKLWLAGTLNSTARNESAQTKSSKSWSISFRMQCEVNISKSKCKPKEAISKWSQWTGLLHSSDNAGTFFLSNRHPKTEMFDSLTGFVSESHTGVQKLRCWTVWQALYQNVRQRKLSTLAALRWWHLTWFSIIMSQTPIRMLSPQKVHLFPDMFCNLDVPVAPFCTSIIVSNLTWELRDV